MPTESLVRAVMQSQSSSDQEEVPQVKRSPEKPQSTVKKDVVAPVLRSPMKSLYTIVKSPTKRRFSSSSESSSSDDEEVNGIKLVAPKEGINESEGGTGSSKIVALKKRTPAVQKTVKSVSISDSPSKAHRHLTQVASRNGSKGDSYSDSFSENERMLSLTQKMNVTANLDKMFSSSESSSSETSSSSEGEEIPPTQSGSMSAKQFRNQIVKNRSPVKLPTPRKPVSSSSESSSSDDSD